MTRVPVYFAERRTYDSDGRLTVVDAAFGFSPIKAKIGGACGAPRYERDSANVARLVIVVPADFEARLNRVAGEELLGLYDHGIVRHQLAPRDAVEAATEGRFGLALKCLARASLPSLN
jgi:hypothetical protein